MRKRFGVLLWLFIFSHGVTIIQVRKVAGKIETFLFNEHWLSFIITMIRDVSFYTLDSINAIHGKQQVITLESSRWNSSIDSGNFYFFPHAKTKCRSIDTCGIFKKIQQSVKTKTFRRIFFLKTKWKIGELEGIAVMVIVRDWCEDDVGIE